MFVKIFLGLNIFIVLGGLCESYDDAYQLLESTINPCVASCEKEPLEYKGFDRKSCARGCRLFALSKWDTNNLTESWNKCKSACDEAYQSKDMSKEACYNGCNNALPIEEAKQKKIEEETFAMRKQFDSFPSLFDNDDPFSIDLGTKDEDFSMFGFDSLMNDMMNHAMQSFQKLSGFMPSSRYTEIFDIKDENGEQIIIIQHGAPEINTPHPDEKKIVLNTGSVGFKTTLKDRLESNLQTNVNKEWAWNDDPIDKMINYNEADEPCCCNWRVMKSKWWRCVRQTDCLTELALIVFWLSVSFIFLAACCMPQGSKKKLSVNSDLAFITDSKGELPDYAKPYPTPEDAKKSPYYVASVVTVSEEKVPLN